MANKNFEIKISIILKKKKKNEEKEKPASFLKDYGPEFEYNNLRVFF